MPALTLDALLRSLKKGAPRSRALDPAYLLYGDEDVLKDEAIRALLDAGALLRDAVGGGSDLGVLARELEKLAALTGETRPATAADVTSLVGVRRGETIYDLVDAALQRQAARATQLVEPVLEQAGMNGVRIVSLLGTH